MMEKERIEDVLRHVIEIKTNPRDINEIILNDINKGYVVTELVKILQVIEKDKEKSQKVGG